MDLVVIEEIRQLKFRYLRTLDLKQWDAFAETFVPEATADYGDGLVFDDRDAIVAFMRESLGPQMITVHFCHHPEITLEPDGAEGVADRALGRWYLEDKVIMPEHRLILEGAAFYDDEYVRTPDGWRISRTGHRRTYEVTMSMDGIEGYRLRIGTAYDEPG